MIEPLFAFQKKLIFPTLSLAISVGAVGSFIVFSLPFIQSFGAGYIVAGPLMHYFTYELGRQNEYYFYFNLGLGKLHLYLSTIVLNTSLGLIILSV